MGNRANYVLIAQIAQIMQQTLPLKDQQEINFGIGFFNANAPPLDPQERRDMLNQLFSTLLPTQR
jgi:hypothetical protein